jgi:hypothetical protein
MESIHSEEESTYGSICVVDANPFYDCTTYSRNRDNARLFPIVSDSQAYARVPSLMANACNDTKDMLYKFE